MFAQPTSVIWFCYFLKTLSKHFICKEKPGASKVKSSMENLTSMIYRSFNSELYFGTFYCGDENILQTSFKLPLWKSAKHGGWRDLKGTQDIVRLL